MIGGQGADIAAIEAAQVALGPRCQRDVPVGPRTTYRVGGAAALYFEATTISELTGAGRAVGDLGLPILVLGRGSNLLLADAGFPGLVVALSPEAFGTVHLVRGGLVRAGAAVQLPVLARQTSASGLTGLEWAVGVPGSVGGAVRMNAGGHGADIRASLLRCRWVDMRTGDMAERSVGGMCFGYRTSAVEAHHVVVDAEFELADGDRRSSEATIRDIVRWRREHQPGGQNAGSVFTNPVGEPPRNAAGWLVDAAGLRGYRRGTAAVSQKHANFIQADPGGTAGDVVALMLEVQRRVKERLGVVLRAEVRLIGFDEDLTSSLTLGISE